MGNTAKVVNAGVVTVAFIFGILMYINRNPGLPDYYRNDYYWGTKAWKVGDAVPKDDPAIRKFTIKVEETILTDLKSRLSKARIPESLPGVNFEYGFNSDTLKKVVEYWQKSYDWRKQEKELNKYPNFKTQIEGLDIHYIHVKPSKPTKRVEPLILLHGWPGSVFEFYKAIHLLSENPDLAFELVIPSLPGYGFSEASHKPGLNAIHAGRIFNKLMLRLGHQGYYIHGGDWGAFVGKAMAANTWENVLGFHTTMPFHKVTPYLALKVTIGAWIPSLIYDNPDVDYEKLHPVMDKFYFFLKEMGYMHLQATKPDTIGTALSDSPVGLAAYILEKFSTWVNPTYIDRPDGGLTEKFTMDELLTNVMIYWVTNSITSSQRFYKENVNYHMISELNFDRVSVPHTVGTGIACFPNELMCWPKNVIREVYFNVTHYTDMPRGGHFAAFEEPLLISDDIRTFVKTVASKVWWA